MNKQTKKFCTTYTFIGVFVGLLAGSFLPDQYSPLQLIKIYKKRKAKKTK